MEKVFVIEKEKRVKDITKESKMFMVGFRCRHQVQAIQMWGDFCVTDNGETDYGKCGDYLIFKTGYLTSHPNEGYEIIRKATFEDEYERFDK